MSGHRTNNLDAIRHLGAALVLVGHAYVLLGRPQPPSALGYSINTLGVVFFFAISGYLITASWQSRRRLASYLGARFLRIFPALGAVVLITAFVVGPAFTSWSTNEYFASPLILDYLQNLALYVSHNLPGLTEGLPYPASINGSLWTLAMEFVCYLVVPLACTGPRIVSVPARVALLCICLWAGHLVHATAWFIWGANMQSFSQFAIFFIAGSLIRECHQLFGTSFMRTDVATALIVAHVLVVSIAPAVVTWISWLTLPYVVLKVGLASTKYVRDVSYFGDFSYGVYLWAFPVQQIVIKEFGIQRMSANLLLVGGITLALAFLSWHLVERPALSLKSNRPRPIQHLAAAG